MGIEKNNQLLYPDPLPSAGGTRFMATGRRAGMAAEPWRQTPPGGRGCVGIYSFTRFIKQMVPWRKQGLGSGTRRRQVIRGQVSLYFYLLRQTHQRGENYEEIRDQKTTRWKVPGGLRPWLLHLCCFYNTE